MIHSLFGSNLWCTETKFMLMDSLTILRVELKTSVDKAAVGAQPPAVDPAASDSKE